MMLFLHNYPFYRQKSSFLRCCIKRLNYQEAFQSDSQANKDVLSLSLAAGPPCATAHKNYRSPFWDQPSLWVVEYRGVGSLCHLLLKPPKRKDSALLKVPCPQTIFDLQG